MNVPYKYWNETVTCVYHIINKTPPKKLAGKCTLEIIRQSQIKIECSVIVSIFISKGIKESYIFLGYPYTNKGYICYDLVNKRT